MSSRSQSLVARLDRHNVAQCLIKTHLPTKSPPRTPRPMASAAALHPWCTAELTGAEERPLHPRVVKQGGEVMMIARLATHAVQV